MGKNGEGLETSRKEDDSLVGTVERIFLEGGGIEERGVFSGEG